MKSNFNKLLQIYKIREKSVSLPVDCFKESNMRQDQVECVLLQTLHALSKARGFAKLKLIEPTLKFDKKRGQKFAALLGLVGPRPCLIVMTISFGPEVKQLCLMVTEDF